MKVLRSFVLVLAIGAASLTSAHAGDSFSIGINVGNHRHHTHSMPSHHVISHHVAPQAVYYYEPVAYHRPAPRAYHHAPVVVQHYYQRESRHHYGRHGHDRGDRGYDRDSHRGHH